MPDTSTEFNQALDTALRDPELQHDVDRRHLEPSLAAGAVASIPPVQPQT